MRGLPELDLANVADAYFVEVATLALASETTFVTSGLALLSACCSLAFSLTNRTFKRIRNTTLFSFTGI